MRLSREQTMELYQNVARLKLGHKPGFFDSRQIKDLVKHPKLADLFGFVDEIESAISSGQTITEIMPKYAKLINTYLDYK